VTKSNSGEQSRITIRPISGWVTSLPRGVPAISMYDPVRMFCATNARNGAVTRRDISHCRSERDRETRRNQR